MIDREGVDRWTMPLPVPTRGYPAMMIVSR